MLNRAKQYLTSRQQLLLYKAQVRPHVKYCSHIWAEEPRYLLEPFDSIQWRSVTIVDDLDLTNGLEHLSLCRDMGSLRVFYRLYNGECSKELFDLVPTSDSTIAPLAIGMEFILTSWTRGGYVLCDLGPCSF